MITINEAQERERFEAWMLTQGYGPKSRICSAGSPCEGEYENQYWHRSWEAWRAAKSEDSSRLNLLRTLAQHRGFESIAKALAALPLSAKADTTPEVSGLAAEGRELTDQQCAAQLALMKSPPMKDGAALHDWAVSVMRTGHRLAQQAQQPAEASERERFEVKFPIPGGAVRTNSGYAVKDGWENSYNANGYVFSGWPAWQARAALAQQVGGGDSEDAARKPEAAVGQDAAIYDGIAKKYFREGRIVDHATARLGLPKDAS